MLFTYLYMHMCFIFIKALLNYITFNYYIIIYIFYYSTCLNINILYLWFLFFMYIILMQILYFSSKNLYNKIKMYVIIVFNILIFILISLLFLTEDALFFVVLFESMLIIILSLSLHFIFNNRFIIALYYLIIFSISSGILCFINAFILFVNINITSYLLLVNYIFIDNINVILLLWCIFYVIFGIKFPIYPFYFWLLAVHVEVSSEISIILASIILKSGFIGILKFLIFGMLQISSILTSCSTSLVLIGLFTCSINLLLITDYKKIVGSWSVLHVNIALLFVWYNNYLLLLLFILSNLGHIISSSSFFFILSYSYENFNNKHIFMISSCFNINIQTFLFLVLLLNNIDFPMFLLFYIEMFNFFAIIFISNYILVMLCFIIIVLFTSSLLLYFIISFYHIKWNNKYIRFDLNILEFLNLSTLIFHSSLLYWWLTIF